MANPLKQFFSQIVEPAAILPQEVVERGIESIRSGRASEKTKELIKGREPDKTSRAFQQTALGKPLTRLFEGVSVVGDVETEEPLLNKVPFIHPGDRVRNTTDLIVKTILGLPKAALETLPFTRILAEPTPTSIVDRVARLAEEPFAFMRDLVTMVAQQGISAVSLLRDEPIDEQVKSVPFLGKIPTVERQAYELLLSGVSPLEVGITIGAQAAIVAGIAGGSAGRAIKALKPKITTRSSTTKLTRQDLIDITAGKDVPQAKLDAFKQAVEQGIDIGKKVRKGEKIVIKTKTPNTIGEILYEPLDKNTIKRSFEVLRDKGKPIFTEDPILRPDRRLPGIIDEPGQARPFGLSTRRVRRVGGEGDIPKSLQPKPVRPVKTQIRKVTGQEKAKQLIDLNTKLRNQALGARKGRVAGRREAIEKITNIKEEKEFLASIRKDILKGIEKEKNKIRKEIGFQRFSKNLPTTVQQRLKKIHGIKEWKNVTLDQLKRVLEDIKKLEKGDTFLTDKQLVGLEWYIKEGKFDKRPGFITKREMIERFKESEEILNGAITKYISNNAFPTVDIKEGHPIIKRIVDRADLSQRETNKNVTKKLKEFENIFSLAEKTHKGILKRDLNKNIFRKMSGEDIKLNSQEQAVVDFLKAEFKRLRDDLGLQKYRQNYITHLQQTWLEKIINKGIMETVKEFTKGRKEPDIPLDVMLALDNIIGSEKFFRFALRRSGELTPTINIRRIYKEYLTISENKIMLDKILPEAQAAQQLLLQNKSAVWLKRYLQNLKGRGLDFEFRSGKSRWIATAADRVVDMGYIRLLGLNWRSAIKNIIGGEVNSFAYQTVFNYLRGKQRFLRHPKKAHKIISESGVLDGSYVDVARSGLVPKGKKIVDKTLYGLMEAAEYEIRGSYLLGEMTKNEWASGILTPERFREILDGIAITQGIYTKTDSPLMVQTAAGRAVVQFGRWKITNSLLMRRVVKGAKAEYAKGEFNGKNTRSLLKIFFTTAIGMYISYELGKAGYEKAKRFAEASAELIFTMIDLATGKLIYDSLANNPSLETLGSFVFSAQQLANYITFGLVEEPRSIQFQSGITDMYVAALRTLGIQKGKKKKKTPNIFEDVGGSSGSVNIFEGI